MQGDTVAHCHFIFENGGMRTGARVHHTVILNVGTITDAYVEHVAAQHGIAPHGSLLAQLHIANNLRTHVDVRAFRNLRLHTAKRSNHDFFKDNTTAAKEFSLECADLSALLS